MEIKIENEKLKIQLDENTLITARYVTPALQGAGLFTLEQHKAVWEKLAGHIRYIPECAVLYVEPKVFWPLYKSGASRYMKIKHNWNYNEKRCNFPEAKFYFQSIDLAVLPSERGIYGLYYKDELIYIGSTAVSFKERWEEHLENFKSKSRINPMYFSENLDYNEVEMKPIVTIEELDAAIDFEGLSYEFTPRKGVAAYDIELIEAYLIMVNKPRYNVEGVTQKFQFNKGVKYFAKDQVREYDVIAQDILSSPNRLEKFEIFNI